jgi:hypothetical protein
VVVTMPRGHLRKDVAVLYRQFSCCFKDVSPLVGIGIMPCGSLLPGHSGCLWWLVAVLLFAMALRRLEPKMVRSKLVSLLIKLAGDARGVCRVHPEQLSASVRRALPPQPAPPSMGWPPLERA